MLRVSKLGDYATVVMGYLALHEERYHCATEVAARTGIAAPTVAKVLKRLLRGGLVRSVRGQGGGYRLARPATGISVADIVHALEGPLAVTECNLGPGICVQDSACAIRAGWRRINRAVAEALAGISLAELVRPVPGAAHGRQAATMSPHGAQ